MRNTTLSTGTICEVTPAYSMDTGYQSHYDEIAGCQAEILSIRGDEALCYIRGMEETWIHVGRLRRVGGAQ